MSGGLWMTLPRLYPILDTATLGRRGLSLVPAAEAMLEGGAAILQVRHKENYTRAVFEDARRIRELCRAAGALFIVDDRADVAAMLDAGVHLGQDDLPPADARLVIGPHRTLGFSTHNAGQLSAAVGEPIDYVAFGPVFPTSSKANPDPVVGVECIRRLLKNVEKVPLVAIGGITRDNAAEVLRAGASSVAVIHDLVPDESSYAALRARMEEWQRLVRN